MIDSMYTLRPHGGSSYVHQKLESWFSNSQKNGVSNGENRKLVGCVVTELQWLVKTCLIIGVLRYLLNFLFFCIYALHKYY